MKKVIGRIFLVLSILLGGYLVCFTGASAAYSQCVIEESDYDRITAAREENASLLEGLRFDEQDLFYDKTSGTFYYSLIEGSSHAFNPSVSAISSHKDVQIAFLDGELTQEMVASGRTVTVLAYTEEFYCPYHLVCTTLPLMNINCAVDPWSIYLEDVLVEMTLFDNRQGAVNRVTVSSGTIRARGAFSLGYPKKSFRLQLTTESLGGNNRNNLISLLGMRQDDDWHLSACYNDQEKVRNVFSMNLWKSSCASDNEAGIDAGMEYKYLELFMNGEYWGLYALGYPIDRKQLGFGDDISKEALYKVIVPFVDVRDVALEDGTVYGYEQKGVDVETEEGWRLLVEYFDYLNANSTDSGMLWQQMDVDNAIDTYLFINLIQGKDNVGAAQASTIYNMYIAVMEDGRGGMCGLYIPWDLDRTWGKWEDEILYAFSPDFNVLQESGYLAQIISNDDTDIWERIFEKYRTLRSGAWSSETINSLLDQYEADIFDSGAYVRDMERWPDGIYADPEDKLNTFRTYVNERLAEADRYYTDLYCEKIKS